MSTGPDATGTYNIFRLDTTDVTGTPDHAGCPCLGDQPLIGADANGFYITTNEFPVFQAGFDGAQVYAMSKTALAAGMKPTVVHFSGLNFLPGLPFFSVQPATAPPGGTQESAQGGTEYLLSSLDFTSTLTNQIAAWALTNTSSLSAATPNVQLAVDVIDGEIYGQPPLAQQMAGPTPLLDLLNSGFFGKLRLEHLGLIASNDRQPDRAVGVGHRSGIVAPARANRCAKRRVLREPILRTRSQTGNVYLACSVHRVDRRIGSAGEVVSANQSEHHHPLAGSIDAMEGNTTLFWSTDT